MKVLKIIGVVILVIMLVGVGMMLLGPSSGSMQRSITINAPTEVVFTEVSNMKTFNKWSPWFKMDPNAEYVWDGPPMGVGARMTWYSDDKNVGNGYMQVSKVTPNSLVVCDMGFDQNNNGDFTDEGQEKTSASFILSEQGSNQTNVTWTFEISGVPTGFDRLEIMMLNMFLGPFYEEGLQNLKERVESRPAFKVPVTIEDVDPITFIGLTVTSSNKPQEIGEVMGNAYGSIVGYMQSNDIEAIGHPLAVYTRYDDSGMDMICGIPVLNSTEIETSELSIYQSHDGMAVKAVHKGDYAFLEETYNQLDEYIEYYGLEMSGDPWEDYPTDPTIESDTSAWITHIYYPVE